MGVTLTIGTAVVWYLKQPLEKLLMELCGNHERAGFWTSFTAVALGLTPLIFAMGWRPSAETTLPAVFELADQLKWALIGLLSTLLVLGIGNWKFDHEVGVAEKQVGILRLRSG